MLSIVSLRKFVWVFALLLIFSSRSQAQQAAVDKLSQALTDSLAYLQLTDQQKSEAHGLNQTAATSLLQLAQKAKADTTLKGKALAQQVMGIMKQRNASLQKLLTPDQMKLFNQHKMQQAAEIKTKMMTTQLDLTDQQVPQVYQLNLKLLSEMAQGKEKLDDSKRKLQKARAAKSMKSDMGDVDKEFKKILSPEQYEKYEKNKEAMQAAIKEKK